MKNLLIGISTIGLLIACAAETQTSATVENLSSPSEIKSASAVDIDQAAWGDFLSYFTDDTHMLKPVLVGVAKIKAGEQIHPPHRHADEEYLMVLKGHGTWYLNGEETTANEGDILYARAWDYHGIRAADDSPLDFVVFKYSARGMDAPTDPSPELPEELSP